MLVWYQAIIVVTRLLQLGDTVWALIVPMLLSPFNIILMRSFFKKTIPEAILESARIDGASEVPDLLPNLFTIVITRYRNHHALDSSWFLE